MKTQGWNANEILIQDVDALAAKLRDSPFKIIGEPRPLSSGSKVRAMQVIGPAGELNYLTCIPPEGGSFIKTPARTFVDRSFIAVVGGTSMDALRAFYQDKLGLTVTATYSSAIDVLQHAWGLTPDTQTRMALAQISPGFLVELDEYPAAAPLRSQRDGDLPPGMAMVSFTVGSLNALKLPWRVKPVAHQQAPYNGRRAAMLLGPAGEWIELVEAK
jgi:catechol 2,3-dioxygenase-like lactoylglutathione lyase family enzyme